MSPPPNFQCSFIHLLVFSFVGIISSIVGVDVIGSFSPFIKIERLIVKGCVVQHKHSALGEIKFCKYIRPHFRWGSELQLNSLRINLSP
uniref:Uncharacterized protein n=1 Tax=Physcomitrium patens TaxID=3218 RepID=A0A2K1JBE0_PHYPA|nr:hypothetical protein PHYPA_019127 [Physcomitrium patens]